MVAETGATTTAGVAATLDVQVTLLSGEPLAKLPDADASWSVSDLIERLPAQLPGRRYELAFGRDKLELGSTSTLGDLHAATTDATMNISAVIAPTENAQEEMDLALIEAAKSADKDRVLALLAAGARATFVHDPPGVWGSQDRKSALHMALLEGRSRDNKGASREIVEALIAAGADVNAKRASSDWRGCGSSQSAFEMALGGAMQDAGYLKLFLDAGADPNTKTVHTVHSMRTDGQSVRFVLHRAVQSGSVEVARTLLEGGADVDAVAKDKFQNERGYNRHTEETSLHIACGRGDAAMVALLLERDADVNRERKDLVQEEVELEEPWVTDDPRADGFQPSVRCVPVRETALHVAIASKSAQVVALLVRAGADITAPRHYDGAPMSPEALCGEDIELLSALRAGE